MQMKIKLTFMQSSVVDVKSIGRLIVTMVIAQAINLFTREEKCLSMIHAQNGKKENGKRSIIQDQKLSLTAFVRTR